MSYGLTDEIHHLWDDLDHLRKELEQMTRDRDEWREMARKLLTEKRNEGKQAE
jgi:hypothetical protein